MKILIALALALTVAATVTPAYATPAMQPCAPTAFQQFDMAGVYIDMAGPMRVEILPCSLVTVLWDNAYGRHLASYTSQDRLPGGGLIASGWKPSDVGYLDNAYTIGFKPAEPGMIQVITVSPYGQIVGVYKLKKI